MGVFTMTEKEYNEYFDRLMGVEGIDGLNFPYELYDSFITGIAKCCICLRRIKGTKKKNIKDLSSSKYVEIPVNERFVPWSMQSSVCEDPGMLDEPEIS